MKTIIIVLFTSVIAVAQLSTYDLIVEYEQECYADSFLTHTYENKWFDRCYEQKGDLANGYYFELECNDSSHYSYIHKQPAWDGFREFVKNKKLVQVK